MDFYDTFCKNKDIDFINLFGALSDRDVERAMTRENMGLMDFLTLLSPAAGKHLEPLAQKAHETTLRHFGKTIQLYTPLYVSDHCDNQCLYCSFNAKNPIARTKLTLKEVEREAAFIAATGLRHILLLTGESRKESPVAYLRDCVGILKRYFHSIAIEVYPLTEAEYESLVAQGVDGLTIYQETYDEKIYDRIHQSGPKKDFRFRLAAPERGAGCRMRQVTIGALLGLSDWRKEVFFAGLHAHYLQDRFPDVEIGVSVPRLRPHAGKFKPLSIVSDKDLVQIIIALRLFLPRLGISLSTRENSQLRDNLVPLGITRLSAGSSTGVGERIATGGQYDAFRQFEIADHRSIAEMIVSLRDKGYDPILSDWCPI
ncbi:MAG: 2-iminoacetate synthase ThiH [Smithellaceae bacterium]|nr:2-iminoacetate synthase ThiH [Smithellaceae bacterium]